MMNIPTCAFPKASVSGLRKVAALRLSPAVVQLARVVHTTVVVMARASLGYPRLNSVVIINTLNDMTKLLNILILLNDALELIAGAVSSFHRELELEPAGFIEPIANMVVEVLL